MRVSVSVSDLPVFARMERLFEQIQSTGADGIELVSGIKSRWRWGRVMSLSEKYSVPITSVHQPPWSALNIYFDERNIQRAAECGVKTFVFHPIPRYDFDHPRSIKYFERLTQAKEKYKVEILLENMPSVFRRRFAGSVMPLHPDTYNLEKIVAVVKKYNLGINLDISHVFKPYPHLEPWFNDVFPLMKNIHLSSFKAGRDHLPLQFGDLDAKAFLTELKKRKYKGLTTFEIYYPKMVRLRSYDYEAIMESVKIVQSV